MKATSSNKTISVSCQNIDCTAKSKKLTPNEFEDFLYEGEFDCNKCGEELSSEGYRIECYICDMTFEDDYSLQEIQYLLDERCSNCAGSKEWDAEVYSIRIAGSWSSEYDMYDWSANGKRLDVLERNGRTDYWEGLAHFCSAEEFISIYKQKRIRASSTGLYNKKHPSLSKAVCLTEATVPNWNELKAVHGDYGFIFRKRDIIQLGGAPAIYLPQSAIDEMQSRGEQIPETLWPYLTKLTLPSSVTKRKHDFLHEREWRVPQNILFRKALPYAVTFSKQRPRVKDEELILHAAREFQELSKTSTKG